MLFVCQRNLKLRFKLMFQPRTCVCDAQLLDGFCLESELVICVRMMSVKRLRGTDKDVRRWQSGARSGVAALVPNDMVALDGNGTITPANDARRMDPGNMRHSVQLMSAHHHN